MNITAPYLASTHTWSCPKGHQTVVEDHGWPQRPCVRQAVLKAWAAHGGTEEPRCPVCGSHVRFLPSARAATGPVKEQPSAPSPAWPDFQQYGRSFYTVPVTPGGSVEARALAGKRKR